MVEVLTVLPAELVVMKRYQLWAAVGCGVSISASEAESCN
jgi:hypothetical protein